MKSVIVELSVDIGHLNAKPNNHQVNQCPISDKQQFEPLMEQEFTFN
jgi:hypothetical protein